MKFMQRAAASSTASSPTTTPKPEEKSSKRRKTSHNPAIQQTIDALVDEAAVKKAIADEERKREEALVRNAAESGDARWVLNTERIGTTGSSKVQTPFNVVQVGFAQIDSPDHTDEQEALPDSLHSPAQHVWRYNMDKKEVCTFKAATTRVLGEERCGSHSYDYRHEVMVRQKTTIPNRTPTRARTRIRDPTNPHR